MHTSTEKNIFPSNYLILSWDVWQSRNQGSLYNTRYPTMQTSVVPLALVYGLMWDFTLHRGDTTALNILVPIKSSGGSLVEIVELLNS